MKRFSLIAVLSLLLGVTVHAAQVGLIKITGAIGPATANYIARALTTAAAQGDACLIIQLDTPGGLDLSMLDIIKEMLNANVPVVVYVSPSGAGAVTWLASQEAP